MLGRPSCYRIRAEHKTRSTTTTLITFDNSKEIEDVAAARRAKQVNETRHGYIMIIAEVGVLENLYASQLLALRKLANSEHSSFSSCKRARE